MRLQRSHSLCMANASVPRVLWCVMATFHVVFRNSLLRRGQLLLNAWAWHGVCLFAALFWRGILFLLFVFAALQ